ncbi:hypothetical protein TNCV_4677381 [Trichonephila clavipes]|nr:hypothetical protein TNCV_4677381 [Trichonephila clavipes]
MRVTYTNAYKAARGLLAMNRVILETRSSGEDDTELESPSLTTSSHQKEDIKPRQILCASSPSAWRVFSCTRIEFKARWPRVRDLDH